MNTFQFSIVQNPSDFTPSTKFVCEACPCGGLQLIPMGDYIIAECDHIVQVLRNGRCEATHSIGVRQ